MAVEGAVAGSLAVGSVAGTGRRRGSDERLISVPVLGHGMDGSAFRATVETATTTELDRLGSSRLPVALTDAEPTTEAVLRAAAHSEHAAHETFAAWAADEPDERARAVFEATAAREADHRERVLAELDDPGFEPADGGPMHAYLRGRSSTIGRVAAGVVGRGLVVLRTHARLRSFFIDEADEHRADLLRDLRGETETALVGGLYLLETLCDDGDDWERARAAAEYAVGVAYDDYADALAGLGLDPDPRPVR